MRKLSHINHLLSNIYVLSQLRHTNQYIVYSYSDIISFELLEDDETLISGGLGGALVGGILFGGVGAIVGGITGTKEVSSNCTNIRIKITVNKIANSAIYIIFNEKREISKRSAEYKRLFAQAHECISMLQIVCDSQKYESSESQKENSMSAADEIVKYKKLLDDGILTQDEFDAKKKQLLGI